MLCAGLLTPHNVLTESLPVQSVALIQGGPRSADGRGQETRAQHSDDKERFAKRLDQVMNNTS